MTRDRRPRQPFRQPPSAGLEQLVERARAHEWLESIVRRALPPALADCCRYAGCHNGEITLLVPDSTRASQVRFQQRAMLQQLRSDERFQKVWRVRVRVEPWTAPIQRRRQPPRPLSLEGARLLQEEAEQTEDPGLRTVLMRLASHTP